MTQQTLVTLLAAGESTKGDVTFNIPPYMFRGSSFPSIMLQGMITAEVVTFFIADGSGWTPLYDGQATPVAGTLDFDSNKFTLTPVTPGLFSVTHTALGAARKLIVSY